MKGKPKLKHQTATVKISDLVYNRGQLDGLPSNPRFIRDEKFDELKTSIREDPELLLLRELILFPMGNKFLVIAGEMRSRAAKEEGYKEMSAVILDKNTPLEQLRAMTIKDNAHFGEWNVDDMANDWDLDQVVKWGVDVWLPGVSNYDDIDIGESAPAERGAKSTGQMNSIRPITLVFDQEGHRMVLEQLASIGDKIGVHNDNAQVVVALLDFYDQKR